MVEFHYGGVGPWDGKYLGECLGAAGEEPFGFVDVVGVRLAVLWRQVDEAVRVAGFDAETRGY